MASGHDFCALLVALCMDFGLTGEASRRLAETLLLIYGGETMRLPEPSELARERAETPDALALYLSKLFRELQR